MSAVDAIRLFDNSKNWACAGDPSKPRLPDEEVLKFLNKEPAGDAEIAWTIEQLNYFGRRLLYVADLLPTLAPGRTPLSAEALADHRATQVKVLAKVDWMRFFGALDEACQPPEQPNCHGDRARPSHPFARGLLRQQGLSRNEIQYCVDFFREHGGHCDCEILFNVIDHLVPPNDDDDRGPPPPRPHSPMPTKA